MRHKVHTDFALRLLTYLALVDSNRAKIEEIASAFQISRNHLIKVAQSLDQAGLVRAVRGRNGGIMLARSPSEITVGAVVRACEEDFALVECMGPARFCRINGVCKLRQLFIKALEAYFTILDNMTIADAVIQPQALISVLGLKPYPLTKSNDSIKKLPANIK